MILFCIIDAIADDTVRYQYVKKKGYVRLQTNKGDLNIELHCDKVRTFTNIEQNQSKTDNRDSLKKIRFDHVCSTLRSW